MTHVTPPKSNRTSVHQRRQSPVTGLRGAGPSRALAVRECKWMTRAELHAIRHRARTVESSTTQPNPTYSVHGTHRQRRGDRTTDHSDRLPDLLVSALPALSITNHKSNEIACRPAPQPDRPFTRLLRAGDTRKLEARINQSRSGALDHHHGCEIQL